MSKQQKQQRIHSLLALLGFVLLIAPLAFNAIVSVPGSVLAQTSGGLTLNLGTPPPLIVCGTATDQGGGKIPATNHSCTFTDLITLANAVITWMIWIAVPLALIGLAYAGWLYLTAGASEDNVKKAHTIMSSLMWGFIWLLVAYALVYTIVNPLLNTGAGYKLFNLGS